MSKKSYDKNRNPIFTNQTVKMDKEWREKTHLEMYERNGNGWEIFVGVPLRHNRKEQTWIEQYKKERNYETE